MARYRDPGWGPVIRPALRVLFMPWRLRHVQTQQTVGHGLLIPMRMLTLSLVTSWWLFLSVVGTSRVRSRGGAGAWAVIVLATGLAVTPLVERLRVRGVDTSSPESLVASYQRLFFAGFTRAGIPVLAGFVAVFLTGTLWVYLVGLAWGHLAFSRVWPSRRNIEWFDDRIRDRGSPLSLGAALTRSPPPGTP